MFGPLLVWLAEQVAGIALNALAKHYGVDRAMAHAGSVLGVVTPLPPDSNPSPAEIENPHDTWHYD